MKKSLTIMLLLGFLIACSQNVNSSEANTEQIALTPTPLANGNVKYVDFNSGKWSLWYEGDYRDLPMEIKYDLQGRMWAIVEGGLSYFDGNKWAIAYRDESNWRLFDLRIANDGTKWALSGKGADIKLVHYDGKNLSAFPLPVALTENKSISMGVDSSMGIWVGAMACQNSHCLYRFNRDNWQEEYNLPVRSASLGGVDVLSDLTGNLWLCGGGRDGIALFQENGWRIYSGKDIWGERGSVGEGKSEFISSPVSLADGSILAFLESTPLIVRIYPDGKIEKTPINPDLDIVNGVSFFRMLIDNNNMLWIGLDQYSSVTRVLPTTLIRYDGKQWYSFRNLPFNLIFEISQMSSGNILISTEKGMYLYSP